MTDDAPWRVLAVQPLNQDPLLGPRVVSPFIAMRRAQGGTGLGLSLVKHILNRHRGRLLIESVPKNGATFTACFPQAKTPDAA